MASDSEQMKKQTLNWCMSIPNHKKNMNKMRLVIVDGYAKFVPVFADS